MIHDYRPGGFLGAGFVFVAQKNLLIFVHLVEMHSMSRYFQKAIDKMHSMGV